ncbi:MAG: hypothetical protein SF162_06450 [bacterium]|nr:hypothetical protein [bacterium]
MTPIISAASDYKLGSSLRERIEDYAADERLTTTPGGLDLQLGIVCDGVGGAEWGVQASRTAAQTIFQFIAESSETHIPTLLRNAVQAANLHLFETIRGQGNTTVALMAIHLNDPSAPSGRLFIASVGDSLIYIVRSGELSRLNIDHNLESGLRRGELSMEDIGSADLSQLTRAVGLFDYVEVDTGFYKGESTSNVIPTQLAVDRGNKGLKLEDGDTLFACSDGVRDTAPDGKPYLEDEMILKHADDSQIEDTLKSLLSYPQQRMTTDNVSMSLIFIGPRRKRNYQPSRVSLPVLVGAGLMIAVIITFALLNVLNANRAASVAEQTAVALEVFSSETAAIANLIGSQTPTPSITPSPTLTLTPTATSTPRPRFDPNQVNAANLIGSIYRGLVAAPEPVELRRPVNAPTEAFLIIDRPEALIDQTGQTTGLANEPIIYLSADASVQFLSVEYEQQAFEMVLRESSAVNSSVFVLPRDFTRPSISLPDFETALLSDAACLSVDVIAEGQYTFGCYGEDESATCTAGEISIPYGQQLNWNTAAEAGSRGQLAPISTPLLNAHYDRIRVFNPTSAELAGCLLPFIDGDGDQVIDRDDQCPTVPGNTDGGANGCPPTATPTPTATLTPQPTDADSPTPPRTGSGSSANVQATDTAYSIALTATSMGQANERVRTETAATQAESARRTQVESNSRTQAAIDLATQQESARQTQAAIMAATQAESARRTRVESEMRTQAAIDLATQQEQDRQTQAAIDLATQQERDRQTQAANQAATAAANQAATAAAEAQQTQAASDNDGDGVPNGSDACPNEVGDPGHSGCPAPPPPPPPDPDPPGNGNGGGNGNGNGNGGD